MAIGMVYVVKNDEQQNSTVYLGRQMGPYQVGREYWVCLECHLRSLGIKP